MCTLTVLRDPGRVLVTMNRDELRARAPEIPPGAQEGWWGPRDRERGGTWMGVNPQGLVACLLNGYRKGEPVRGEPGAPTRGEIVPRVLSRGRLTDALAWIREDLDPTVYASFLLVVVDADQTWEFYGSRQGLESCSHPEPAVLVTSSAWPGALEVRAELFRGWQREGGPRRGTLPSFHLLQLAGQEGASPLMARPQAATRSITQVEMRAGACRLRYWPVHLLETSGSFPGQLLDKSRQQAGPTIVSGP